MCVFSIFDGGGGVCVCMCVYTHAHTHTPHLVLDVRPGVGKRHLEGPRNPGELNLGTYVFVYVYKVHKWTCMMGGGMRPGLTAFLL